MHGEFLRDADDLPSKSRGGRGNYSKLTTETQRHGEFLRDADYAENAEISYGRGLSRKSLAGTAKRGRITAWYPARLDRGERFDSFPQK